MRNILFSLCLLFSSANSFAQYNNVCDVAYTDFNNLIEAFLQLPTEQIRNEEIYNRLDELQNIISHIPVFVAGTPYAKFPAMPADMPVEPFEAFPEEFHICRKTHVTFIACGISHAHVKVLKIWFPV